jgi:hypothetical protein
MLTQAFKFYLPALGVKDEYFNALPFSRQRNYEGTIKNWQRAAKKIKLPDGSEASLSRFLREARPKEWLIEQGSSEVFYKV